jgi:large subunit ribosomal protein L31
MKEKIHPKYHQAKVTCACGAEWVVGSTKKEIKLDVCSSCHPFFTGKQRAISIEGRIEKFKRRYGIKEKTSEALDAKK